jgi:hypothetical protein
MTTAAAPQLESDRESPPQSHRGPKLVHTTRCEPDAHSLDGTQGQQIGSRPYDDATQGVRIGSHVYDDATRSQSPARGWLGKNGHSSNEVHSPSLSSVTIHMSR